MIVALTPNPALDLTAIVDQFAVDQTARVPQMIRQAGGKGLNLARALHTLGTPVLVVAPLGRAIGRMVLELAMAEGIACDVVWIDGETRMCWSVIDSVAHTVTDVNETGPQIDASTWQAISERVQHYARSPRWLTISGSVMGGTPSGALHDLIQQCHAADVPVALDTYGPQLAAALPARPALVKINQHEAADLIGQRVTTVAEARAAAALIQRRGAQAAVITLGALGAVGSDADGQPFGWQPPATDGAYTVGSGDALFGGIMARLDTGAALAEAVRFGVAVGAANTLQPGAAQFDRAAAERLEQQVQHHS